MSRLWTSTIVDDCGNESTANASKYIVVLDTIAPQFTNTCDIENGETVEYTCGDDNGNGVNDIFDFLETPAACAPSYIENCDSEVALTMTADTMGYVPTGDIANYCMPATVEAIANGETRDDRDPEAIRLFNFEVVSPSSSWTVVYIVEVMADSTLHIVLETTNAAGDAGFIFDAIYDGGHDWNEWLALPGMHNYKKDCAEIFPGIEIWTEWIYYVMDNGTMSGTGRFAGSEFTLSHQPLNAYYGLQVGEVPTTRTRTTVPAPGSSGPVSTCPPMPARARWPPAVTSSSTSTAASDGRSTMSTLSSTTVATATDSATPIWVRVSSEAVPTARSAVTPRWTSPPVRAA